MKKKKVTLRKLIFMLLSVVLLLAVAEVGWLVAYRSQYFAAVEKEEEEELIVAPFFVHMDSLVVPVIRNDQVVRHVMLTLILEVGDNRSRSRVQKAVKQIRDAFVRDLHGYIRVALMRSHNEFLMLLKGRLLRVVGGVVGPGVVREVLIPVGGGARRPLTTRPPGMAAIHAVLIPRAPARRRSVVHTTIAAPSMLRPMLRLGSDSGMVRPNFSDARRTRGSGPVSHRESGERSARP